MAEVAALHDREVMVMSLLQRSVSYFLATTCFGLGAALIAQEAIAQTSSDLGAPERLGTDDNGSDLFGDSSSPFNLIHRAILAPTTSAEDFRKRQERAISSEAEDFRLRQQEAILQQQTLEAENTPEELIEGDVP